MEWWNDGILGIKRGKDHIQYSFFLYTHHERKVAPDGLKTLHYVSNIPVFHHSNCERSELNSVPRKSYRPIERTPIHSVLEYRRIGRYTNCNSFSLVRYADFVKKKMQEKPCAEEKFSNGLAEEVFLLDKRGCLL